MNRHYELRKLKLSTKAEAANAVGEATPGTH